MMELGRGDFVLVRGVPYLTHAGLLRVVGEVGEGVDLLLDTGIERDPARRYMVPVGWVEPTDGVDLRVNRPARIVRGAFEGTVGMVTLISWPHGPDTDGTVVLRTGDPKHWTRWQAAEVDRG